MTIPEQTTKQIMLALGYTSEDETLKAMLAAKAAAVIAFLQNAGAGITIDDMTELQIACVAIGVNDISELQSGKAGFSPAFMMIAKQLAG